MYKISSIILCILTGIMIATYGWLSLLWTPVGFIVGIFIASNTLLLIILGLPKASSLVSKGEMTSKIYFRILRTPFIWIIQISVILILLAFIWPSALDWLLNNKSLDFGFIFAFVAILISPISKKVRIDFYTDFEKSFARYYTNFVDIKVELESSKDKKLSKHVEAAIKVFSNLYTHTTNKDDDSKYTLVPDAKYRYMIFCMSSLIYCCEDIIYKRESFISDCISFISVYMTSRENAKEFFSGVADVHDVKQRTPSLLNEYLNNWASYNNASQKNDMNLANSFLCKMMHSTMSNEPLREADRKGLEEIASSITEMMPAMRAAFIKSI